MDTTLSSRVPGTVVPYEIFLASKNCIKLRAGLSILKVRWYKFSTFLFTTFWTLSISSNSASSVIKRIQYYTNIKAYNKSVFNITAYHYILH